MEEERKEVAELRNKLLSAMTRVIGNDPLYNDDQIEALAEAFYWKVYELADFAGNEPKAFICDLLDRLHEYNGDEPIPSPPMEDVGNHRFSEEEARQRFDGHRSIMEKLNAEKNSWLNVFPSPLSMEEFRDAYMPVMSGPETGNYASGKLWRVLATSMDERAKDEIRRLSAAAGFHMTRNVDDKGLVLVVFGNGKQASTKTQKIKWRLEAGEDIQGIYFREYLKALREDFIVREWLSDDELQRLSAWDDETQ